MLVIAKHRYNNGIDRLEELLRVIGINIRNSDESYRGFKDVLSDLNKTWVGLKGDFVTKMVVSNQMVGIRKGLKFYTYLNSIND